MSITYQEKPKQHARALGRDPNLWPGETGTIWRVLESDSDEYVTNDLLLILATQYKGYAILNLRSEEIRTHETKAKVTIIQDFTVNTVTLYADNTARP